MWLFGTAPEEPLEAAGNNAPITDLYFINKRGERQHLRIYVPEGGEKAKAVMFFWHGYGGHNSNKHKIALGKSLAEQGYLVVQPDLIGHGYSEGERAFAENWQHWIDDHEYLIELFLAGPPEDGNKIHSLGISAAATEGLPFFIGGESLGGGQCLALSLRLKSHQLQERFKGMCLLAPAIKGNLPPAVVVFILRHTAAKLFPKAQIPDALESVRRPNKVWKTPESLAAAELDRWGKCKDSLGWGHNMRFGMAMQMLDQCIHVEERLDQIDSPFLVMHDPEDGVIQFAGTEMLMERSPSAEKKCIEMHEGLHDLATNCGPEISKHMAEWMGARLKLGNQA
ncbi:unnamed protein product [Chrysoparadoxa australica]